MIFSNSMDERRQNIELNGDVIEVVKVFKYLGHFITFNFRDNEDITFRLNNFYASFNSIFRDFNSVDQATLLFLFKSYCLPDYGLPLWSHANSFNSKNFKAFEVGYNKAIKRICKVPPFASSHITMARCNMLLLRHHTALTQARYCKRLLNSRNTIIRIYKPFIKDGFFMTTVFNVFNNVYNVSVIGEELDILRSRIEWVQRHEERRAPCLYYGF